MTINHLKVLLIGDSGQLGSELLTTFNDCTLVKSSQYSLDIADHNHCLTQLDQIAPNVIINAAAYTAVDKAEQQREQAFLINAEGPKSLATWCANNSAGLIHISTDYVFAGDKPLFQLYDEADSVGPLSIYGESKLLGETHIQAAMKQDYAIFRTAWLYGSQGNNFIKTMLKLTINQPDRQFKVVSDQYGSPTSTLALSQQIKTLLEYNTTSGLEASQQAAGVFHATSSAYCSWYDFACEFFDLINIKHNLVPCTTAEYPTDAKRPTNSILDNQRLRSFGIDGFDSWKRDLQKFVTRHGDELLKAIH